MLFDLDGTLADSESLIAGSLVHALAVHGHSVTPDAVFAALGPPMRGMLAVLIGPVSEEQYGSIRAAYLQHYSEVQLPRVEPLPGAQELLAALDARGVACAVVTNKAEHGGREQLDAMGWHDRFEVVVGFDSVVQAKPAPDPALFALERLGVAPADAAFVGDTGTDMECARAAGIAMCVGLAHVRTAEQLRAAGATHVARDLREVAALLLGAPVGA